MQKKVKQFSVIFFLVVSFGFRCSDKSSTEANIDGQPAIILISVDGFRWDYPEKTETPNLDYLIANGVRAKSLIPCFPTKTFPNHYSIVTGLYPDEHGIIANNIVDAELGRFSLGNRDAIRDPRWWGGEPIWVTAEKQGQTSACYYWPGSETDIKGVLPTYWYAYDGSVPNEDRIEQVLEWLKLPTGKRPSFITTYFSFVDDAGHDGGPDSQHVIEAIQETDRLLGLLIDGLKERNVLDKINVIVVSDHGMAEISSERVVFLDDYIDLADVDIVDWNPVAAIRPLNRSTESIYQKLAQAHPHMQVYRKQDIPERLHYGQHPRVPDIVAIADEGWSLISHGTFNSRPGYAAGGNHGFDNQLESMGALFIASGPAFKSGVVVEPFLNIHIYNLLAEILEVEPAPNSGDLNVVKGMLR